MSTVDQLTLSKVASVIARGFTPTGIVLTSADGKETCIVDQSAVRWLSETEMRTVMNPPCTTELAELTYEITARQPVPVVAKAKPAGPMDLDGLKAAIKQAGLHVERAVFTTYESPLDGSSRQALTLDGIKRASWKSRLIRVPVRDGVTPRGPAEYYDLEFFPAEGGPK